MSQNEWSSLLKKVFFFSSLNDEELQTILEHTHSLSLPKNAVLFRQGDPGDALYIVVSGRLRLVSVDDKGAEKTVAHLGRADSLGDMALLTGEPRRTTAYIDGTAEIIVLYKTEFEPLMQKIPTLALHISHMLSRRLTETMDLKSSAPLLSKIFLSLTELPQNDHVPLLVNLCLSLVEQTRRKVLLLDLTDKDSGVFAKALGLDPVRIGEKSVRHEDLQSKQLIERLAVVHPSGLELMSMPLPLIEGRFFQALYPFLNVLRQTYDFVVIHATPRPSPVTMSLCYEADQCLVHERHPMSPASAGIHEILGISPSPEKILKVELVSNGAESREWARAVKISWPPALENYLHESRSPYLRPEDAMTQRQIDRLARRLGRIRIGLALGSGASYGYVAIGMLKVLEKNGIFPDVISGTSIGALIGSFYAAGKNPDELEAIAKSITKTKLWSLADFTLPWQGIIIGQEVLKFLRTVLGNKTFEELQLPFACVATDIQTGEEVILKHGKVAEAVRASLSLPFFFQPYFHHGRYMVDGGLVNPVPTAVAAGLGADVLISLNLTAKPSQKRMLHRGRKPRFYSTWRGPSIMDVLSKTIYTMQYEIAHARAELAHVTIAPDMSNYNWADFYRSSEIVTIGEAAMEEALPKVKSFLPFFSDYCRMPLKRNRAATLY